MIEAWWSYGPPRGPAIHPKQDPSDVRLSARRRAV